MKVNQFEDILAIVERAKVLGSRTLANGAQLIGHVPHVAPEAYLHIIFDPLSEKDVYHLEQNILRRSVPDVYRDFLMLSNGLSLYSDSLTLDGLRRSYVRTGDEVWQPFAIETPNLFERPKDSNGEEFFIGGYGRDGSLLYLREGMVFRCARKSVAPLNEWSGFWEMLVDEVNRLAKLFDNQGKKINSDAPTTPD